MPTLPTTTPAPLRSALAEAKEHLKRTYGDRLRRVVLYGSRARGDATEESDVDLLVVLDRFTDNQYQELKRIGSAWGDLMERYGLFFSFQLYTEAQYQARRGPFMRNVHEEGVPLMERPFADRSLPPAGVQ